MNGYTAEQTAAREQPQSPLDSGLMDLRHALGTLGQCLDELMKRTTAVCKPEPPSPVGNGGQVTPVPLRSPMGDTLHQMTEGVRFETSKVNAVLKRLEL